MGERKYIFQKGSDDMEYRIVGLHSSSEDKYNAFGTQTQIQISQENVLEVRKNDGTEYIWTGRCKNPVRTANAGQILKIHKDIPLQRLWVASPVAPELWYKIPQNLPVDGVYHIMLIPGGANTVKLRGDKYFCAAYEFTRNAAQSEE